jgi:hypothetical protein
MAGDDITEYRASDYSAIDSQLNEMTIREQEITKKLRIENAFRAAQVFAIICLSLGLLAIMIGFAIYLAIPKKTIAPERGAQTESVQGGSTENSIERQREEEIRSNAKTDNQSSRDEIDITSQLTIFATTPSNLAGVGAVTTGYNYNNSKDIQPAYIFCYVLILQNDGTAIRIELGAQETANSDAVALPNPNAKDINLAQQQTLFQKCEWWKN